MNLRVAGLTQAHQIVPYVSAAFGNGQNVVYFLHRSQLPFLETLFAQRMLCGVAVTDAFPRSAVLFIDVCAALVFVVLSTFLHTVLFTKLSLTKIGAAGVGAWSEWSLGHCFTSFGHKKSPTGFDSHETRLILLYYCNHTIGQ